MLWVAVVAVVVVAAVKTLDENQRTQYINFPLW